MSFFFNLKLFIEGMSETNKEFITGVKQVGKEFSTDMKDVIRESNPAIGGAIDGVDRTGKTIKNGAEILLDWLPNRQPVPSTVYPMRYSKYRNRFSSNINEDQLQIGDHLYTERFGYSHHALYLGDGEVIHYSSDRIIEIQNLEDFKQQNPELKVVDSITTYSKDDIIVRAYSRLGESEYNLVFNNCEHFVLWCRNGSKVTHNL